MQLTHPTPDDFHAHLRDGREMAAVVADPAVRFARGMPNLKPPVTSHPGRRLSGPDPGDPVSVHSELMDPEVDVFAREGTLIERVLVGLLGQSRGLKVVLEHITTRTGARSPAGPSRAEHYRASAHGEPQRLGNWYSNTR